jgi:hypothetical protein
LATVRTEVCRATAIIRSTALSERGSAGGGSGKLKTATSSPPMTARDARRPIGIDTDRNGLETREGTVRNPNAVLRVWPIDHVVLPNK